MKKVLFILLMITTSIVAQKNINNYKYIIVPNKFDFLKKENQYQTSSLTKFLFNKHGFNAFLADDKLPEDLGINRCLALTGIVKNESGMFSTKCVIELRDCFNKIIFTSTIGTSKQKDYKKGYHEAIRKAFKSIKFLNYKYSPLENELVEIPVKRLAKTKAIPKKVVENVTKTNKTPNLYAQEKTNGFQLINTKPEVVFQIIRTNVKDVFIIKDKNGILYKSEEIWIAEYYNDGIKKVENYQVKF